jgi:hypothetical protein
VAMRSLVALAHGGWNLWPGCLGKSSTVTSIRRPASASVLGPLTLNRPQPDERLHTRSELADRERLHHVIVRTRRQACDPVVHLVPGGQDADRDRRPFDAQPADDLYPRDTRQPDIEHDRIGATSGDSLQRPFTRSDALHGKSSPSPFVTTTRTALSSSTTSTRTRGVSMARR